MQKDRFQYVFMILCSMAQLYNYDVSEGKNDEKNN